VHLADLADPAAPGHGAGLGRLAGLPSPGRRRPAHRGRRAPALPRPLLLRASPRRPRGPRRQGEAFAVAVLQFSSGALGIIEANHHGPPGTFDDEIEITGTDATLRLPGIESLSIGYRAGAPLSMFRDRQWSQVPVRDDDYESSVLASVAAFLDAVTAGDEPPVTGADALETMRLLHQIYDSAVILRGTTGP
jgi:predicted dehydrogenase